jgi:hypothetical protein
MTDTFRDPDDRAHDRDTPGTNYHDEEQEIQNDEASRRPTGRPMRPRKIERRPPPRKRHYED